MSDKTNVVIVNKDTLEIPSLRTEFSKTFYVTDEQRKLVSSRVPLHVKDKDDKWVDITCEIKNNKVINCPYKAKLLKNQIGYHIERDDSVLEIAITDFKATNLIVDGNVATWKNAATGVDVVLTFTPMGPQFFRLIKNKNSRKSCTYKITMLEEVADKLEFHGLDDSGKEAYFTQKEISTKKLKRDNKKMLEKVIKDTFERQVVDMDEKTRKRFYSNDVTYPVRAF